MPRRRGGLCGSVTVAVWPYSANMIIQTGRSFRVPSEQVKKHYWFENLVQDESQFTAYALVRQFHQLLNRIRFSQARITSDRMTEILLFLVRCFFGRPPFEQRSKLQAIAIRRDGRPAPRNYDWNPLQRLMTRLGWLSESVASFRQPAWLKPWNWFWRCVGALPTKLKASFIDEIDKAPHPAADNSNV